MSRSEKNIYIDPPSKDFGQDKLFDLKDSILNRDGTLLPFHRLRLNLQSQGAVLRTADYLFAEDARTAGGDYYSLGILSNYQALSRRKDIKLRAFVVLEPPVTAPHIYRSLPQLTRHFERVYLHNTVGEGYSLQDVDQSKLHTIHWPQPYKTVQEPFWSNND